MVTGQESLADREEGFTLLLSARHELFVEILVDIKEGPDKRTPAGRTGLPLVSQFMNPPGESGQFI